MVRDNWRCYREQDRRPCYIDAKGKKVGFGSWYERLYNDYSCEELYAPQGHNDRVRTCDLMPQDRVEREANNDDSMMESDWLTRIGAPLLRLGQVSQDKQPNRTRAIIDFGNLGEQLLPTSFAIDYNGRTDEQKLSFVGQTNYNQKERWNSETRCIQKKC